MLYNISPFFTAYVLFVTALIGLVMGSFLNAWGWRTVHNEKISRGRSHCAVCGHTLGALDLIPLFSYLLLGGKCRYCGEKISKRYPIVEAVCAVFFITVVMTSDLTVQTARYLIVGSLLLVLSLVDLDTYELPDGIVAALAASFILRYFESGLSGIKDGLIGCAFIALPLLAIVLIADKIAGRETMGGGDIKLLGALGLHFGVWRSLLLVIIACIFGLVLSLFRPSETGREIPFGPAIACASWVVMLFGQSFITWYLSLFF